MSTHPHAFGRSIGVSLESSLSISDSGGCAPPTKHSVSDEPTANEAKVLNALIVGLLDHIEEHRRAVFAVETRLGGMQRRLYDRVRAVVELQTYVRALGAEPATTRSPLADAVAARLACEPYAKNNERELMEDIERSERNLRNQIDSYLSRGRLSESGRSCVHEVLNKMNGEKHKADGSWSAQILGIRSLRPMNE
jgi:hypothetical protein